LETPARLPDFKIGVTRARLGRVIRIQDEVEEAKINRGVRQGYILFQILFKISNRYDKEKCQSRDKY